MSAPVLPATSFYQLLKRLLSGTDTAEWVSATVLTKYRSSYRKPGAMMLVSPFGQTQGLISGGCLESDIVLRARRVLEYGKPEFVIYDSMEDGNIAAELGLGCNGRIGVLVEEITGDHRALYEALVERMDAGLTSYLVHDFDRGLTALLDADRQIVATIGGGPLPADRDRLVTVGEDADNEGRSVVEVKPPVRLLIAGGGIDARPVAELAGKLGWRVTVADHRTVNARTQDFPLAESVIGDPPGEIDSELSADAVIIMTHNLDMDARWLDYCRKLTGLKYLGLLGPVSRKEEVFALAGLDENDPLVQLVQGPMGIDIGGDLPESVAISVIAQCHQFLAREGLV